LLNANKKIGLESALAGIRRLFLQATNFHRIGFLQEAQDALESA